MAPLRIGVMMEEIQLTDMSGIDILGNLSKEYVDESSTTFPEFAELAKHATPMQWYYLGTTLHPTTLTPSVKVVPNCTYDDCPRDLDILLIGGPRLIFRPAAADKFLKEAYGKTKVIMTTCVGSLWLASAGVLKGKKATTNRRALSMAREMYPDVEWIDQRWVVDGNLWTAGGAGAGKVLRPSTWMRIILMRDRYIGIDMVGTYALENWPKDFVNAMALDLLDFDPAPRGQFYK